MRSWPVEVVLATGNRGKVREWERLLGDGAPVRLVLPSEVPPVEEDQDTYQGNALKKARSFLAGQDRPVLAEDSGLEVVSLGMAPGVRSARVAGSDPERIGWLLERLRGERDRRARFVCVAALAFPDGRSYTFRGELWGTIAERPMGDGGFGYDPVFMPLGLDVTLAQVGALKDRISHRARAARRLVLALPLVVE
ncbi:non-canonical purine NTP pyrophosphatase [Thermanaerovibrio acidaminovorans]|jgi:XTP/dITP diphosphohydrolase|nr:non-canonical purine NTP pyrophosphatase [Thermanaerovibrio acidaminovorans]